MALPIDAHLPAIVGRLREAGAVVLAAEPGAGKSTRVPPAIVRDLAERGPGGPGGVTILLQPRRVAARAVAERIADEQRWRLGPDVGYQVRFERKLTDRTPLQVVTEGILTARLTSDPLLEGVACVILDEFHERSIHADLALAMLREVRAARPELRVVVMSATLDAAPIAAFLGGAPVIEVPGRAFPVDIEHRMPPGRRGPRDLADAVADVLAGEALDGDALVFLPGAAEIDAAVNVLARRFADVRPLHGSLPFEEQRRALLPGDGPRVICATNIAETSLTIDGVTLVVDTGLARRASFDERRGMDRLDTVPISRASAQQRAGRAGRTRPGRCVRLWTAREHGGRAAHDPPELARVDPAEALLAVYGWSKPADFGWFEPPPPERVRHAEELLAMLGAIEGGRLTDVGRALRRLPTHPRLGRLLVGAAGTALADDAAWLAAVLGERGTAGDAVNLAARLEAAKRRTDPAGRRVAQAQRQLRGMMSDVGLLNDDVKRGSTSPVRNRPSSISALALVAYPDRVCRMRPPGYARGTAATGGVRLAGPLPAGREFVVALDVRHDARAAANEATVTLAAGVSAEELEATLPGLIREEDSAEYDADRDKVVGVRRRWLGGLALEEKHGLPVPAGEAERAVKHYLANHEAAHEAIAADEELALIYRRVRFLEQLMPDDWEPPVPPIERLLDEAAVGARSVADVRRAAVKLARRHAEADWRRELHELAPESVEVPTGSRVRLDWSESDAGAGRGPVLAVKLQEMFGLARTPRVGPGAGVAVTLHLLGPNYRPVQVTDDLASFWANTYPQVRKDLRARYPRHFWPEDPLAAPPTRGVRRRG